MSRQVNARSVIRRSGSDKAAAAINILLLGGLLISTSPLPAAAQQAAAAEPSPQTAAGRGSFSARVRDELAEWRGKMDAFDKRVDASGHRTADAAAVELRTAWNKTEAAGRRIEAASAQDWDDVKASYETASHELASAWNKARP